MTSIAPANSGTTTTRVSKPTVVPERGHIRVVSLGSPVAAECPRRLERALRFLRAAGYVVSEGRSTRWRTGHTAGEPWDRAEDLLDSWNDPSVDVILSVIGGHNTNQILEFLPFEEMARHPKLVVGYSDTTALTAALWSHGRVVSFQGPALLPQIGDYGGPAAYTYEQFRRALHATVPLGAVPTCAFQLDASQRWDVDDDAPRLIEPASGRRTVVPGQADGFVFAANMGTLLSLAGTAHFPSLSGAILILEEDEEESPGSVDRYLTHMRQLGVMHDIAGLILGRFPGRVGLSPGSLEHMIRRATRGIDIPIFSGLEFGHVDPMCTLPVGVAARMDASRCILEFAEPALANATEVAHEP